MNEALVHRRVGLILHDIARIEQAAGAAFSLLARVPDDLGIVDEDRRTLRERVMPEERGHDVMMSAWASAWAGPAPRRQMAYSAACWRDLVSAAQLPPAYRLPFVLATIAWSERNTLRSHAFILRVLERLGEGAASDWRQLVHEEAGHIEWASGLVRRLEGSHPVLTKRFTRYLDYTSQVYPTLVARSHGPAWAWVAERLGLRAATARKPGDPVRVAAIEGLTRRGLAHRLARRQDSQGAWDAEMLGLLEQAERSLDAAQRALETPRLEG